MTKRGAENVLRAREGIAVPLRAGEALRITNLEGGQVVDTWVLAQSDPGEYVSMEHTRVALGRLIPVPATACTATTAARCSPSPRTRARAFTTR